MGAVPYYSELPSIIDIHPEGLLSLYTTHKGYNVDYFLSLDPSFVVLPKKKELNTNISRYDGIYRFYSNEKFKKKYEFLFSLAFNKNYFLYVYKNKKVNIPQSAIQEGKIISKNSYEEVFGRLQEHGGIDYR